MNKVTTSLNVVYIHVNMDTGKLRIRETPDFRTKGLIYEVDSDYILSLPTDKLNDSTYVHEHIANDIHNAELIYNGAT